MQTCPLNVVLRGISAASDNGKSFSTREGARNLRRILRRGCTTNSCVVLLVAKRKSRPRHNPSVVFIHSLSHFYLSRTKLTTMKPNTENSTMTSMTPERPRKRSSLSGGARQGDEHHHSDESRPAKRVRFETRSPNTDELKTYEKYLDIYRSELNKPKMWWNRAERSKITAACHDDVETFRRDNVDHVHHFLHVFDHCQQMPSEASSDYLEKATLTVPARFRGLEWGWAPSTVSHRKAHSEEVLSTQRQIKSLSPAMKERVLSSRALRSSRPCRVLARILGEGDERQSRIVQEESSTPSGFRRRCRMMPTSYR